MIYTGQQLHNCILREPLLETGTIELYQLLPSFPGPHSQIFNVTRELMRLSNHLLQYSGSNAALFW